MIIAHIIDGVNGNTGLPAPVFIREEGREGC